MKPFAFVDRHVDSDPAADWSDTVPACFRSEAFAEDLPRPVATGAMTASGGPPPRRPRPRGAWVATLALLGRRPAATP